MQFSNIEIFIGRLKEERIIKSSSLFCSDDKLDDFFLNEILICSKYHYVSSYCARNKTNNEIVAVFTLTNDAVILGNSEDKADFIEEAATKMPEEYRSIFEKQTSFPAVNIGHLGVRKDMQSRGIGKQILDFILSTFIAYKGSGCQFITVDSLNNRRTNKFYASNGFTNQTNMDITKSTRRMYLPIELYRDEDEDKDEDEG